MQNETKHAMYWTITTKGKAILMNSSELAATDNKKGGCDLYTEFIPNYQSFL